MTGKTNIHAIAVDGGGTQCRIAVVTDAGCETVLKGPANAFSDLEGTVQTITAGLRELSEKLSVSFADLTNVPAYLGLAGVINDQIKSELYQALPLANVRVELDRNSAIRAALGIQDGVIAHCGTGSFFGVQRGSALRFVGGWGAVLDDIASAHWMACRSLTLTLYATDGLIEESGMTQAIMASCGSPTAILELATHGNAADIAQFAQKVSDYEARNDEVAVKIFNEGAGLIADVFFKLDWNNEPICLTGGLGARYCPYLPEIMHTHVIEPQGEPLEGAIQLALEYSRDLGRDIGR